MFQQVKLHHCTKLFTLIGLLLVTSLSQAEIFKWVDSNGKTHYSERRENAGKAKVEEVKVKLAPVSAATARSTAKYWEEQEKQFKERQAQRESEERGRVTNIKRPKSLSGGRSDGSDVANCNFAKDVLSGALVHSNGLPTNDHDRQIANMNVRAFCR